MAHIEAHTEYLQPLRHVDSLRILVHPMYYHDDPYPIPMPVYAAAQRRFAAGVLSRFTPKAAGEVLLVMPNVEPWKSLRQDVEAQKAVKAQDPSKLIWPDLFRDVRAGSPFPNNVRFVGNIGRHTDPDGSLIVARLAELGFFIDESTEVIFGGQWLDRCVTTAAKKVLALPNVREVKIDRHSAVPSNDFDPQFYPPIIYGEPYEGRSDGDYYYYRKTS